MEHALLCPPSKGAERQELALKVLNDDNDNDGDDDDDDDSDEDDCDNDYSDDYDDEDDDDSRILRSRFLKSTFSTAVKMKRQM